MTTLINVFCIIGILGIVFFTGALVWMIYDTHF